MLNNAINRGQIALVNGRGSGGSSGILNQAGFWAPFNDAGSGAVDTTLARGAGSATFTRATTATTVNSAGTIVSVASGTARSYYDPTSLAYLGYLSEGARTNLCLQSADLSAADWLIDGGTKTAGFATAPDGTLSAGRYVTAAVANLRQVITVVASTQYTFSFYAKSNGGSAASYRVFNISGGADIVATTSYFSSINSSTFTRITVNFTTPVGCTSIGVYMNSNANADTLLWGMQVEAGSFASTYIPTTTASVTRNADVLTYPSSGNILGTVGTFYCEATLNALYSYNTLIAGSTGNRYLASIDSSGAMFSYDGTTAPNQAFGVVANSSKKFGISWGSGRNYAYNGSTSAKAFDGDFDIGPALNVGFEASGVNIMFGTLRNVRIYQTQLSASQLQAVTV